MSIETLVPPIVLDLVRKVADPKVSIHERENLCGRLEAIEELARKTTQQFRKSASTAYSQQRKRR
jgi:hypothetical protein